MKECSDLYFINIQNELFLTPFLPSDDLQLNPNVAGSSSKWFLARL